MAEILTIKKKHPFSGWPMVIAWLAMFIFAGHSITHMVGAGDTWVAMACGRHFINHGFENVTVEPFSANSHKAGPTDEGMKKYAKVLRKSAKLERKKADSRYFEKLVPKKGNPVHKGSNIKASIYDKWANVCESYENWPASLKSFAKWIHPTGWVNQNWLTHTIFYWSTHILTGSVDEPNFNTLVWWKFSLYLIAVICVYYATKIMGGTPALAALAACLSVFIGRSFYDVRPAGFSNMLVAVLMLVFVLTTYRSVLYIWLIVPLLVFWCNVHGGYIYVFMVLVPFIGTHFLLLLPKKWRVIFYSAGAVLLFVKCLMAISNTRYYQGEDQILFLGLLGLGLALLVGGFIFAFYKDRFVSISLRGLIHITAAATVSFFAAVLFNPYHLTNFTHTLIVSVSEHAKMWKQVHEWHPAFSWSNPVGTAVPFLIVLTALIGLAIIWLFNYTARMRFEHKTDNIAGRFTVYAHINRAMTAVLVGWLIMLSFQFVNPSFSHFFAVAVFVLLLIASVEISGWILPIAGLYSVMLLFMFGEKNYYSGAYIYPFLILPGFVFLQLSAANRRPLKHSNLLIAIATTAMAFTAMIFIGKVNPLGLKIDGFAGTISNFWNMKPPFKPIFNAGGNREAIASNVHLFGYLAIIWAMLVAGWFIVSGLIRKVKTVKEQDKELTEARTAEYGLPKIDLALLIITVITVYLALTSRRFITLAGVWMCPFAVLFLEQAIKTGCSIYNNKIRGKFVITPMPLWARNFIIIAVVVVVGFFGTYWAVKYDRIYIKPFASEYEDEVSTVFMRMTASNVKPFKACQFIRENNISGNMYNYWTEGGFIAYGQTPDPNTGKTPLQLYMDGRAQAAYEPAAYTDWIGIMGGGHFVGRAKSSGRKPTKTEYKKAGEWINGIFEKRDVWVVLMPVGQFNSAFLQALLTQPNWQCVFGNNNQRIFVDTNTEKGKKLFGGLFTGKTKFPTTYSKNMTMAFVLLRISKKEAVMQGYAALEKAISEKPSRICAELLNLATRHPFLRPKVAELCQKLYDDFEQNKEVYSKQKGYRQRLISTLANIQILQRLGKLDRDFVKTKMNEYTKDPVLNAGNFRW